jgi:hypothetical protein
MPPHNRLQPWNTLSLAVAEEVSKVSITFISVLVLVVVVSQAETSHLPVR